MFFFTNLLCILFLSLTFEVNGKLRRPYIIDIRSVCRVKTSCLDCLKLKHCSWCPTEKKCFSNQIPAFEDYCKNDTIKHNEYGFSLEENAECSCAGGQLERHCYPTDVTEGVQCSGRGKCVCGQCVCDTNPDSENPTMVIMGEYCEFDNFSCRGSKCNEGPYFIDQTVREDVEEDYTSPDIDHTEPTSI
ncbi:hypothetical protein K1T71_003864 [Dendrolimus kikuchii]|uniref:Uncharacterized protein n=1 Tax=Dendrolimus kikuchii TaxID=765133 RepID=A0ACC1D9B3_9NEOP|nr:hypothetical protein K1T71_003864 [Dendrolimus kikuchii]